MPKFSSAPGTEGGSRTPIIFSSGHCFTTWRRNSSAPINACAKVHLAAGGIRHGKAPPIAPGAIQEQLRQRPLRVPAAREGLRAQRHHRLPHLEGIRIARQSGAPKLTVTR